MQDIYFIENPTGGQEASSEPDRPRGRHAPSPTTQSCTSKCHAIHPSTETPSHPNGHSPHLYLQPLATRFCVWTFIFPPFFSTFPLSVSVFSCSLNMLLKAASTLSLLNLHAASDSYLSWPSSSLSSGLSSSPILPVSPAIGRSGFVVLASKGANNRPLTGVVFEPFEEVKKELLLVPTVPQESLSRHKYTNDCESAINEQIKWVLASLALSFLNYGVLFIFLVRKKYEMKKKRKKNWNRCSYLAYGVVFFSLTLISFFLNFLLFSSVFAATKWSFFFWEKCVFSYTYLEKITKQEHLLHLCKINRILFFIHFSIKCNTIHRIDYTFSRRNHLWPTSYYFDCRADETWIIFNGFSFCEFFFSNVAMETHFSLSFYVYISVYCLFILLSNDVYLFLLSNSVEYNVSYAYHAMYAYFDRDNVALKGLAK